MARYPVTELGGWTKSEHARLQEACQRYRNDERFWDKCATSVGTKTKNQCMYHWREYCSLNLDRMTNWTDEEEMLLKQYITKNGSTPFGRNDMRRLFPHRSVELVRTKWRRLQRQQKRASRASRASHADPIYPRTPLRPSIHNVSGSAPRRAVSEADSDVVIIHHVSAPLAPTRGPGPPEVTHQADLPDARSDQVSSGGRGARTTTAVDAAVAIFSSPESQTSPASRNRAQEVLAKELFENESRQIEIALALFRSGDTWTHNRDLAQTVLIDHIHRFTLP